MTSEGSCLPRRYLIVNADDFGASRGINRAVVELHEIGILTSASLTVMGCAVEEAASIARAHPALSVGLHWDVIGEDDLAFDLGDLPAVQAEVQRQLDQFVRLVGRPPSHLDSHRHAHRRPGVSEVLFEVGRSIGVPVRDDGAVRYLGDFYAQWEWLVTDLDLVSVQALVALLEDRVEPGWTELACHPGHSSDDFTSVYGAEREAELESLRSPEVRSAIDRAGIFLVSYWDWGRLAAGSR